jgi:serine/threonine-protein kinase RsbT
VKHEAHRLPLRVPIREEADVGVARRRARALAEAEGFPEGRAGAIATAVSEVARNIVVHAGAGELTLSLLTERGQRALVVIARDEHPGIHDVDMAMVDGYSTRGSLGLGLSSAKRLMDEFTIVSARGEGTTVTMKKWAHDRDE